MSNNHKPVNDPETYTQDLIGLLSSQVGDSSLLLHSIGLSLALLKSLPTDKTEIAIDKIIEQITEYQKKQNIELETFAKIKNVKFGNEE